MTFIARVYGPDSGAVKEDQHGTSTRQAVVQEFGPSREMLRKWARGIVEGRPAAEVRIFERVEVLVETVTHE